jgi:hypothetical protein
MSILGLRRRSEFGGGGGCQGIVRVMWEEYLQIEELASGKEGRARRGERPGGRNGERTLTVVRSSRRAELRGRLEMRSAC